MGHGVVRNHDQALGPKWNGYNVTHQTETCDPYCLFDVSADPGENHNLASDPDLQDIVADMNRRLTEEAATGAPVCQSMDKETYIKTYLPHICSNVVKTGGYWLP